MEAPFFASWESIERTGEDLFILWYVVLVIVLVTNRKTWRTLTQRHFPDHPLPFVSSK